MRNPVLGAGEFTGNNNHHLTSAFPINTRKFKGMDSFRRMNRLCWTLTLFQWVIRSLGREGSTIKREHIIYNKSEEGYEWRHRWRICFIRRSKKRIELRNRPTMTKSSSHSLYNHQPLPITTTSWASQKMKSLSLTKEDKEGRHSLKKEFTEHSHQREI